MSRRLVIACVVMLLPIALAATVVRAQEASPSSDETLTLRIGTIEDMVTDNPLFLCCAEYETFNNTYDKLVEFDPEDLSAGTGGLSEGCTPNEDSTEWSCVLKPDLRWSDGEPLTADDVAFSFRFLMDLPAYRPYFPFDPTFEVVDERTLIWKAEQPTFAPLIPPYVYILPEHIWGQYEGADRKTLQGVENTPAVGSGPFTLVEWKEGELWRLERNPYWRGPEPAVDEIVYDVYTNEQAMVQDLMTGQLDAVNGVTSTLAGSLEGRPDIVVHRTISDWWLNFAFNFGQGEDPSNHPAIADLAFREAFAHAIDRAALASTVYPGDGVAGDTVVRPASTYWHLDIPTEDELAFDPELARSMLEEGGYVDSDGDGIREDPVSGEPLILEVPVSQATAGAVDASQLLVGWLDAVGIRLETEVVGEGKMYDHWGQGDYDGYIWYWYGDPDPDFQLSVFTTSQCGGWSDGCFSDPTFDQLYEEQRSLLDREARREVVFEAQRYLYEQVPGLVLAYPAGAQAYRTDRLEGWMTSPGPQGYVVYGYGNYQYLPLTLKATGELAPPSTGLPPAVWIGAGVVIAVVVVALVAATRRRRHEEA